MELKNLMEQLVWDCVSELVKKYDVCDCERCRHDIAALALNHLSPQYYVTQRGEVYSKIKSMHWQEQADIISAVTRAIQIVKQHPRH